MCPGRHLAFSNIWNIVASVLALFDVVKSKDAEGNEIEVNGSYDEDGIVK